MAFVVQLVVGEFHAIEADDLTHPCLSRTRRVRVNIEPGSDAWVVCIPGYHPLRAVIHVPENARSVALGAAGQSQEQGLPRSRPKGFGQGLPANLKGN